MTLTLNQITLQPEWPAPKNIKAYTTLRTGGVSIAPYQAFNLADHVGDNARLVEQNRQLLKNTLALPSDPIWLTQTHSTLVLPALPENQQKEADASYTHQANQVCVVLTADCLPIFLCHRNGTHVAAIHAGWRGLVNGVIEATLMAMNLPNQELLAWLGPAIGPKAFEVGPEVREQFMQKYPAADVAFVPSPNHQRWLCDLYALAKLTLQKQGITDIFGGDYCTYSEPEKFYSYRRDGKESGRMASLIWITDSRSHD